MNNFINGLIITKDINLHETGEVVVELNTMEFIIWFVIELVRIESIYLFCGQA